LEALIHGLLESKNVEDIVLRLQEINDVFVNHSYFNLGNIEIFPIEVESYLYHPQWFPDTYSHINELQRNRFFYPYLHRKGNYAKNKIISGSRGGMDIVLSNNNSYHFGLLIRMVEVLIEGEHLTFAGPAKFKNFLLQKMDKIEELPIEIRNREKFIPNQVFHLPRIGLNPQRNPPYYELPLRTINNLEMSKRKSKDLAAIISSKNLPITQNTIECLLGRPSTVILNGVKKILLP
jgi:hypothetical protein